MISYSKITMKGCVKFVKQVSKQFDLCRFSNDSFLFIENLVSHHIKACFEAKTQEFMFVLFIYPFISVHCVLPSFCRQLQWITDEIRKGHCHEKGEKIGMMRVSVIWSMDLPQEQCENSFFEGALLIIYVILWNSVFNILCGPSMMEVPETYRKIGQINSITNLLPPLKKQVWKSKLDELDFLSSLNLIFIAL